MSYSKLVSFNLEDAMITLGYKGFLIARLEEENFKVLRVVWLIDPSKLGAIRELQASGLGSVYKESVPMRVDTLIDIANGTTQTYDEIVSS